MYAAVTVRIYFLKRWHPASRLVVKEILGAIE